MASQRGHGAFLDASGFVTVGLDKLDIAARPLSKMLTGTVKMIAYRAETAMVTMRKRHWNKEEEARDLVRELSISTGDIKPDEVTNTLTIRIHRTATAAHDKAIAALLEDLNSPGVFSTPKPAPE